jgi:plasmid maintenance system antidote protein VapI
MKREDVITIIERVGLKRYAVAMAVGINPVIFSDYLHNRRDLTPNQVFRLENYLGKFAELI